MGPRWVRDGSEMGPRWVRDPVPRRSGGRFAGCLSGLLWTAEIHFRTLRISQAKLLGIFWGWPARSDSRAHSRSHSLRSRSFSPAPLLTPPPALRAWCWQVRGHHREDPGPTD
eukprot:1191547-Prorocentrum_minimum.AAC.4